MAKKKKVEEQKAITIKEYAALAGIKTPSVSYRIAHNDILPGIKEFRYDVATRQYKLYRDESIPDEDISKYLRRKPITQ